MTNFLENLTYSFGVINREFYKSSTPGEQTKIQMTVLAIVIASFMTGFIFGSFMYFFFGQLLLGIIVGVLVGSLFFLHDKSLLEAPSKQRLYFRFAVSIMLALVITVPLKVWILSDSLKIQQAAKVDLYNQEIYQKHVLDLEEHLNAEMATIQDSIIAFGEKDQYGRITQSQKLIETRRKRDTLATKISLLVKQAKDRVHSYYIKADSSMVGLLLFFVEAVFSGTQPATEYYMNIAVLILFLGLESWPVIGAALLHDSHYMNKLRDFRTEAEMDNAHKMEIKKLSKKQIQDIDKMLCGGNLKNVKTSVLRRKLLEEYSNLALGNFEDEEREKAFEELLLKIERLENPHSETPFRENVENPIVKKQNPSNNGLHDGTLDGEALTNFKTKK